MIALLAPFATWLANTFTVAIAFFVTRKGILFAAMTALIAVVGTAINVLVSEIDGLIGSVLEPSNFVVAIAPTNLTLCFSAIVSCHIACTGYRLTIKFINWKVKVMTS